MTLPTVLRTDAELNMGGSWPADQTASFRVATAPDDRPETLVEMAPEADLIYTCYAPVTADVINAASRLRGIVKYGVGVDSIDLEAAAARGVPVVHCPDYGTDTVADHAFALLISVARRLTGIDRGMQQEGWLWPNLPYEGVDLAGKTLGIIGFGRIGKAMARRGGGFGMRRLVCDPYVPHDTQGWGDLTFATREEVIEQADFLSLHCVLTPETRGLLDDAALRRMKRSAILVNVSRGDLIDEAALVDALRDGRLAGAGLDVFSHEPLERQHPLFELSNVVLTPHFAFYTREAYERLEAQCLTAVQHLLSDRLPPHVKNAEALARHGHPAALAAAQVQDSAAGEADSAGPGDHLEGAQLLTEGDVNRSPARDRWRAAEVAPATQELLRRDEAVFLHQSLSTPCLTALDQCDGSYLVDLGGKRLLDFHGNSAHQVGYRHPRVIDAVRQQLETLPFCPRRFTNQPATELAERLTGLAPGPLGRVLFAPGGTSAVGIALKLARYATGRHKTISMWDTFHGASLDAISIGGESLFRDGLGPLLPGAFHVPWPHREEDAAQIEKILQQEGDVGAVVAEPMRCTTVDRPPSAYWQRVRQLCDDYGALLIFDEIPLCLGRTGKMFCCEHTGVTPDMLVIGKGLGGGVFPMAAVIVRDDLNVAADRALGHYTHEKSPLGAAAALATLDVIESEGLLERSAELGRQTVDRLNGMRSEHPMISDVRGLGLAMAVELSDVDGPAVDEAERVLYACLSAGLSFKVSDGNVLTLTPPLTISDSEMDQALSILASALHAECRAAL